MLLVVKIGGSASVATANILDELTLSIKAGQRVVLLHGGFDLTNKLSPPLGYPVRIINPPGGISTRHTKSTAPPLSPKDSPPVDNTHPQTRHPPRRTQAPPPPLACP